MKKADYATLADILRKTLQDSKQPDIVRKIAESFASRASVDKAAFLAACGLK